MSQTTGQYWDQCYGSGRDFQLSSSSAISQFLVFADPSLDKTCLDIGCGTGQLTRELVHRGYKCVGIDASASAIKIAQTLTVAPDSELQYLQFDIENDDINNLPQQQFSLITCKLVYAFIKDRPLFLKKVRQLLAPGGIFVMITPLPENELPERKSITVSKPEIEVMGEYFDETHVYKAQKLTCFVGRRGITL